MPSSISRLLIAAVLVGLAALATACGKDKGQSQPAATTPTPADDPAGSAAGGAASAPVGDTGTIAGKVHFEGDAPAMPKLQRDSDPFCAKTQMTAETVLVNGNKTLRNVLVRLQPGSVQGPAPTGPVEVSQQDCMYRPRVQGAMTNQEVVIKNADATTHNVHAFDLRTGEGQESLFNLAQPSGAPPIIKETNGYQVMKLKCDVHPWMAGYIVVTDHPFFVTTGEDGSFTLERVPLGTYTVEAWHEHYGLKTAEVEVAKDGTAEVSFSYSAADNPS
jgi:hypothetical protein